MQQSRPSSLGIFDFEENYLFAYLTAGGEAEISAHLMDDHRAIRPIGAALAKLARGAVAHGFLDHRGFHPSQQLCFEYALEP
jgi:hypothetical protein